MGKNIIVSEDTIRDLLEAHASLSAWYYELWSALRIAKGSASAPDDAARAAFVERMAVSFPELASIVRSIGVPRMFVPPPPAVSFPPSPIVESADEPPTAVEPAPARLRELQGQPPKSQPGSGAAHSSAPEAQPAIAPPPLVVPSAVKYET